MTKPVEYRLRVAGFGTWRIAYKPAERRWGLAYNARMTGEQWVPAGDFNIAETAAIAVSERTTSVKSWDGLRFPLPAAELGGWATDASESVQADAAE
jgi:hypothetical protein